VGVINNTIQMVLVVIASWIVMLHHHSFPQFELRMCEMHLLVNSIECTIYSSYASEHLIKPFLPWPIRKGCANDLTFLLVNLVLVFHLVPLVTHLLPTLLHII
jgi:hypothetical protein